MWDFPGGTAEEERILPDGLLPDIQDGSAEDTHGARCRGAGGQDPFIVPAAHRRVDVDNRASGKRAGHQNAAQGQPLFFAPYDKEYNK
jgi:hypothetical protein